METTTQATLIVRKPSIHHIGSGLAVLAFGAAGLAAQFLALAYDLTDSIYIFFVGLCVLCILGGILMMLMSLFSRCCGLCGRGLDSDRKVIVSERVVEHVAYGLQHNSPNTIVEAVQACPPSGMEPRYDLELEYCPRCKELAVATFKRPTVHGGHDWSSEPVTFSGPAVPALIDLGIKDD